MNILKVTLQHRLLITLCLLMGMSTAASAQTSSVVTLRFANPQYDAQTNQYKVDAEMKAVGYTQELFGMNVRFFYSAADLEFLSLENLHPGYALLGEMPKPYKGNADSGPEMFGFEGPAAYVNGAIQLEEGNTPLEIHNNEWVKAFEIHFSISEQVEDGKMLCPTLIWDLKAFVEEGLFPGDNGVRLTLVEKKATTKRVSAPCLMQSMPFNWDYYQTDDLMPFGYTIDAECFRVGEDITAVQNIEQVEGYALYQNYPNPFDHETLITFTLPREEEALLVFYDVTGREIGTIQGDFKAGLNKLSVARGDLIPQGGTLFYRLKTTGYTSEAFKMTALER